MTLDPVTCSLAQPLLSRLHHAVDILLFNPPYVPTETEESSCAQNSADIAGSWAGGTGGMEVTDRLLQDVEVSSFPVFWDTVDDASQGLLSPQGRFYLVALKQNDISIICSRMLEDFGLFSQVKLTCQLRIERILIAFRLSSNDGRGESIYS